MRKTLDSLKTLFVSSRGKAQNTALTEGGIPRGGNVGDYLPLFKGRDQMGRKVRSETFPGRVTKLIFLSDSCASCIEVLKLLEYSPRTNHCLVIKGDPEPYSNADLEDISYEFPIFRSSRVVSVFGIQRVPTIVTVGAEGRIERVDELADPGQLGDHLEASSPGWPGRDQGLPVSMFPDSLSHEGKALEGARSVIRDQGPALGSFIPNREYVDRSGRVLSMHSIQGMKVLLFISMHCVRCLELVAELQEIQQPSARFLLFSTGNDEDHQELDEFLQRKWPILALSPEQMGSDFLIRTFPFVLVADEHQRICHKGTVYTSRELVELAGIRGGAASGYLNK
ncbi:hypothetical protein J25TS5_34480 [Paenibacillus faecis]|nr:hypothetical protein J25TS5_34480 [Paenibacillus faecis]